MESFILALLAIVGWGFWGFFSKIAVNRAGWPTVVILESICYALFASIFVFQKFSIVKLEPISGLFIALSALASACGGIIFYRLLSTHPTAIIVGLTSLYPVVTFILGVLFLHEAITIKQFLGIIFAVVAVALLSL